MLPRAAAGITNAVAVLAAQKMRSPSKNRTKSPASTKNRSASDPGAVMFHSGQTGIYFSNECSFARGFIRTSLEQLSAR